MQTKTNLAPQVEHRNTSTDGFISWIKLLSQSSCSDLSSVLNCLEEEDKSGRKVGGKKEIRGTVKKYKEVETNAKTK